MDTIETQFGKGKSLYDVLEIEATANTAEVKKAYFKMALKCHPDKCPGDTAANARFQALSMVHAVLSDPKRRSLYDETGEVSDERHAGSGEGDMWFDYWRTLFPKITVADIDTFSQRYKGSEEETQDVIKAYKKAKGNMRTVADSVMLATAEDEERFRNLIESAITREEIPAFAAFRAGAGKKVVGARKVAAKRKAKMDKEAAEAEELMAKIKGRQEKRVDAGSLSTHRSRQFDSMVSSLEARYGGGDESNSPRTNVAPKRTKKAQPFEEPDDVEFDRIQKRLEQQRSKR